MNCEVVPHHVLDRLLPGKVVHQGIAAQVSPIEFQTLDSVSPELGFLLVLDDITDPHNVGALWRSAAAFGAQAIILPKQHCPPIDGTVAKVACGAIEQVPCIRVANLCNTLAALHKKGFFCVGLAEEGEQKLSSLDLWPIALVIGSEGKGLSRLTKTRCQQLISIDHAKDFSTLNASVAGAIGMYHLHLNCNQSSYA